MAELHWNVVYGPVNSRRFGASLGVNLLPPDRKVCNFNCTYCQYGWSRLEADGRLPPSAAWPKAGVVVRGVERALAERARTGEPLARLTIAGHGEPTLHPDFPAIVRGVRAARDRHAPDLMIAVLSNASTLDRAPIRKALAEVDERHMKLDAGDTDLLQRINGSPLPVEQIVAGLQKIPDVHLQAMFIGDRSGRLDNTGQTAVSRWLDVVRTVKPREVHVYTIDRQPAFPFLRAVPIDRLETIAGRVREAGIPVRVIG
jgi:wyosine [tRNA(Phe)-imidazoG37] synthetase (radical SAM superfamily)